jgi:ankyrin repeat protein
MTVIGDQFNTGHYATMRGSDLVRLLPSDSRVNVNPFNNDGKQLLYWAAYHGNLEALKILIADPRIDPWAKSLEAYSSRKEMDVMYIAIEKGYTDVVIYLNTFWWEQRSTPRPSSTKAYSRRLNK